jgi:hypothetical protein
VGVSKPISILIKVDLPAPLSPSNPVTVPTGISKEICRTTGVLPKYRVRLSAEIAIDDIDSLLRFEWKQIEKCQVKDAASS